MKNLVATTFSLPSYVLSTECTFETVKEFALECAKFQQSTSAQLRLWVSPDIDPDSPESRSVAGQKLDDGLFKIAHKLCEVRVSNAGMAIAESFASLQSIVRNAFPVLKGKGGGVSVRYLEVRPDAAGDFGKTSISNTKAFADSASAEWSRVGHDGILRIAKIAWKQAIATDILDKIETIPSTPGGDNIGIIAEMGENAAILPRHGESENGHRELGYTQAHLEEIVQKAVTRDRKNRRVRLEERDVLSMIQNCHGEIAMSIRVAAMKRFGLIEPIIIPVTAPLPNRKRNTRVIPEDITS